MMRCLEPLLTLLNKRFLFFLLFSFFLFPVHSHAADTSFSKEEKLFYSNVGALAAVTAWGIFNWDYFDRKPHMQSEGWFSEETKEGGSDKLGHFQFSYSLSHIMAYTYENWGYSRDDSAFYGALSSFGIMSWMELGDSFSEYGFSYEDFVMNILGSVAGYYLYTCPSLSEKIDFRFEYIPHFDTLDIFTDYDNSKFLLAIKLDGFESVTNKYLQYLEFHIGYYVREESAGHKDGNLYVGFGINLSKIFNDLSMRKMSAVTRYIQVPYTYIEAVKSN